MTDRRAGTHLATLPPDGETVWWFADTDGDEFGHWVAEPFAGRPATAHRPSGAVPALPGVEDGYPAGLEIGRRLVAAGTSTDDGTRIWLGERGGPARVVYAHAEDAGVGALSDDETLLAISHSEHGDSRHPAVRVVRTADGSAVAEKSDGPGLRPDPAHVRPGPRRSAAAAPARAPRPRGAADLGRRRGHRDRARARPARRARRRLHPGRPGPAGLAHPRGAHPAAPLRPRDRRADRPAHRRRAAWARPTSARTARSSTRARRRRSRRPSAPCTRTARTASCSPRRATRAPGSVPVEDLWVDGPGGPVHALIARPEGADGAGPGGRQPARRPARRRRGPVLRGARAVGGRRVRRRRGQLPRLDGLRQHLARRHRGAARADRARGRRRRRRRVRRRRGSSTRSGPWSRAGRGAGTWRCWRPGRSPGAGPGRWPVCRWPTTSPPTPTRWSSCARSTGRCSAGRPTDRPDAYRASSPLTYVDAVTAPVLVLAGENDPRCPIRQVDNYLDALAARGGDLRGQPVRRGARLARRGGDDAARRNRDRVRPPGLRTAGRRESRTRLANVCVMLC